MTSIQKKDGDKEFYDTNVEIGEQNDFVRWAEKIRFYFHGYSKELDKKLAGTNGIIAELGAGSASCSICASGLTNVSKVFAVDISMTRMEVLAKNAMKFIKGNPEKIEFLEANFNEELPFEDNSLDAILFDAAMHHSRSMWHLLSECRRVLKNEGILIAQRESFCSPLRAKKQFDNLLKSPEIAAQVSENMYIKEQYLYYLNVCGFDAEFYPHSPNKMKSILKFFNGRIFCDGILIAYPK